MILRWFGTADKLVFVNNWISRGKYFDFLKGTQLRGFPSLIQGQQVKCGHSEGGEAFDKSAIASATGLKT